MGIDKVMTEVSPEARRAYEERAAQSEPGVEGDVPAEETAEQKAA